MLVTRLNTDLLIYNAPYINNKQSSFKFHLGFPSASQDPSGQPYHYQILCCWLDELSHGLTHSVALLRCAFQIYYRRCRQRVICLEQQYYNNIMDIKQDLSLAAQPSNQIQRLVPPPSQQHTAAFEKFQHNLCSPDFPKTQPSKDSIDTECTSNPPDHSDKHSLKSIDEVIEFQPGQQPQSYHLKLDFQREEFSGRMLVGVKEGWRQAENTLVSHFQKTMKIDKYLRLVTSIIKTWRAYQPKSRLNNVYKELILARRVIRWEAKYDTIIDFVQKQEGAGMKLFKIMQLLGDIVDLVAFWLKTVHKGTQKHADLIGRLEQTESNFYFAQCCIWLFVYTYRYLSLRSSKTSGERQAEEARKKLVLNMLKAIKYSMDVLTSYNNSSLKRVGGEINHKMAGFLTFFSSAIGIYLLWK